MHFLSTLLKQWKGEAVQKKEPALRKDIILQLNKNRDMLFIYE